MTLEPIPVESAPQAALPVEGEAFELRLPMFEGPFQLLLHLIESRQLDVLNVPLADVADAYLEHLESVPVDAANLSEFVAVAAQLILLKSRRLLPGEPGPPTSAEDVEPDEDELRRRLIEYRALRDAARMLANRDLRAPLIRREPRETDLPPAPVVAMPASRLVEALERLASVPEPEAPPPEIVAREITIGMQIQALLSAMAGNGRVVLQSVLAACQSRTEAAVTLLAALELVRRRRVSAEQASLFGPILLRPLREAGHGGNA
jgi:segregation and condensation protein A